MRIHTALLLPLVLPLAIAQVARPATPEVRLAPPVLGLAFARDGRLAVCDADGLRLVDPRTGAETVLPGAHAGAVAAALAADALAAVEADGDVAVWNTVSGERVAELAVLAHEPLAGAAAGELRLRLSYDGARVTVWRSGGMAVEIAVAKPEDVHTTAAPGRDELVRASREVRSRLVLTPPASEGEPREFDLDGVEPVAIALDSSSGRLAWSNGSEYSVREADAGSPNHDVAVSAGGGPPRKIADLAFDHGGRLLVLARYEPDRWKLEVVSMPLGGEVEEFDLGTHHDDLVLAAAASAPRFLIARIDDRIDVYDADTLEVTYTVPIPTAPNIVGETFRRDVFGISDDGEVMAMAGEGGAVSFATTGPGFFLPTTLRLPREAGLPYALRFDASLTEVTVGCRGASPGAPAREWVGTLETENFAAGWTPTAADPARHPYAWSADGATRAEVLAEVEWRVARGGEQGWSRVFGARAVAAVAALEASGLVALALEDEARVLFLSLANGTDAAPGDG